MSAPIGSGGGGSATGSRKPSSSRVHTPSPAELQTGDGPSSSTPKRLADGKWGGLEPNPCSLLTCILGPAETANDTEPPMPITHPAARDSPNTTTASATAAAAAAAAAANNNNTTNSNNNKTANSSADKDAAVVGLAIKEEQMEVGSNHGDAEADGCKATKRPRCDVEVSDAESNTVNSGECSWVHC